MVTGILPWFRHFFHFHCVIINECIKCVSTCNRLCVYIYLFGSVAGLQFQSSTHSIFSFSLVCLLELHGWMFGRDYGVLATLFRPLPQLPYSPDQHRGRRSSHEGSCSTIVFFSPLLLTTQATLSKLALLFWCRGNVFFKNNNKHTHTTNSKNYCYNKMKSKREDFSNFCSQEMKASKNNVYNLWLFCSLKILVQMRRYVL